MSLFMLALLNGFAGKKPTFKGKRDQKRALFCVFPLENMTEGLNNMAAMENTSEESCRPIFFQFQLFFWG